MFLWEYVDHTMKKLKSQTANILTLFNLMLGAFSIIFAMQGQLNLSLLLIFLAALADRFDGMVARKLQIESEFGKQLDSMCDIISFGVAPALLIYQGILFTYNAPGMIFCIIYIACGAIRLARFNITENNGYFTGLPITAAGCLLTLSYLATPYIPSYIFMYLTLALSILMISTFKLKKV
ncbi:CDP-diacylglycerol--serine O-phosphatidyltransferase [Bacillus suaedaesalsae]|uniref:CDP-diacylglycerol--serine O-phosphatidyltransferase n=1 Tax=Bacillus suaedaesalsae TaxID=2810349 RepID=A0ABS2DPM7_9BACI|nr:CDP-diacylglycerol--serine O-phosphatidyltransferase [Bacillus suaedaesalsae]MBM6619663.1 CDP-diacylglycerol--serine O-phosphatidyltransferase [Bacillus suaedaesalsae]